MSSLLQATHPGPASSRRQGNPRARRRSLWMSGGDQRRLIQADQLAQALDLSLALLPATALVGSVDSATAVVGAVDRRPADPTSEVDERVAPGTRGRLGVWQQGPSLLGSWRNSADRLVCPARRLSRRQDHAQLRLRKSRPSTYYVVETARSCSAAAEIVHSSHSERSYGFPVSQVPTGTSRLSTGAERQRATAGRRGVRRMRISAVFRIMNFVRTKPAVHLRTVASRW
jgi:hypothetical protein